MGKEKGMYKEHSSGGILIGTCDCPHLGKPAINLSVSQALCFKTKQEMLCAGGREAECQAIILG